MENIFNIGQLWVSTMEPELGLGIITELAQNKIKINFATSETERFYSKDTSPLKRVKFQLGETIKSKTGTELTIKTIKKIDNILYYYDKETELIETNILDTINFLSPSQRLLTGTGDSAKLFQLRTAMIEFNCKYHQSQTKGFLGPKVTIFPHQLFIAQTAATRQTQRLLLADEVGLGKTIEACLIMHHLLLTNKITRVLIIVPDPLLYQWFVELYRKFNMSFTILDLEFYQSAQKNNPEMNPFETTQLGLTTPGFIFDQERYQEELLTAGWDLVIIDEIHHWQENTPKYNWCQELAQLTANLLLLTATPEMLGYQSLFTICHLLYPDIYNNYDNFVKQTQEFSYLADIIDALEQQEQLTSENLHWIEKKLHLEENLLASLKNPKPTKNQQQIIDALLDNYGLGHLIFRNTRERIKIFPKRELQIVELPIPNNDTSLIDKLTKEFHDDISTTNNNIAYAYQNDPRINWLVQLLLDLKQEKVLLICHTKQKVTAIQNAIRSKANLNLALFHEDLTLLQRDRMAAHFAEPDGAQLLLCSEIGSEGRNFQFAQHLVFFDYPLNLELIEQRIGRLDRIGQVGKIHIHAPIIKNSPQEVIVNWLDQGCKAFTTLFSFGNRVLDLYKEELIALATTQNKDTVAVKELIKKTQQSAKEITIELANSRDRLLGRNSFQGETIQKLTQEIKIQDANPTLAKFMIHLFKHFGLQVEELENKTWLVKSPLDCSDLLPGFRGNKMIITFDRTTAMIREDFLFLSWDHPMVRGAIDLFLGTEQGNANFAHWPDKNENKLYIESFFLVECIAPANLPVERYLHLTPIRILIDNNNSEQTEKHTTAQLNENLKPGSGDLINDLPPAARTIIKTMIDNTEQFAQDKLSIIISNSIETMNNEYSQLIAKQTYQQKINPHTDKKELAQIKKQQESLATHLTQARLRLDSIRFIWRGNH